MISVITVAWSVRLSVTLVYPARTAGRNEMPVSRDIRVAPIVLDTRAAVLHGKGD